MTRTLLKVLGIKNTDGEMPPGSLVGDLNVNGRAMVACSPSPKITTALWPILFPEGLVNWTDHSDVWVNEK